LCIDSFLHLCLLFFPICCIFLYSTCPSYSYFICFINSYFPPSIVVNLMFKDWISKSKLPIFKLIIAMAWNISIVLLPFNTSFASFELHI
jgi:hypothetical protein